MDAHKTGKSKKKKKKAHQKRRSSSSAKVGGSSFWLRVSPPPSFVIRWHFRIPSNNVGSRTQLHTSVAICWREQGSAKKKAKKKSSKSPALSPEASATTSNAQRASVSSGDDGSVVPRTHCALC